MTWLSAVLLAVSLVWLSLVAAQQIGLVEAPLSITIRIDGKCVPSFMRDNVPPSWYLPAPS
jgi:hypothetical protein